MPTHFRSVRHARTAAARGASRAALLVALAGVVACRAPVPSAASLPSGSPPAAARTPLVIGHRGASGHAPEHTFAAWDLAIAQGADYIEQDLQLTRDGVLVVLHDETLDRTARGPAGICTGRVIDRTLAELRQCEVGSWFNERHPERARPEFAGLPIPTLEAVFARYGHRVRYYIETKNPDAAPGMEEALLRLLDRFALREGAVRRREVLIQSFSEASLRRIHAFDPQLPLVQLVPASADTAQLPRALRAMRDYAVGMGPAKQLVTPALIEAARAHCLAVHPYTVNEPAELRALMALGVDGMFTDYPDRLRAMRDTRGDAASVSPRTRCRPVRRPATG